MEKENKSKRWLAFAIALIVFVVSLYTNNADRQNLEEDLMKKAGFSSLFEGTEEVITGTDANKRIFVLNVSGVIQDDDKYEAWMDQLENARNDDTVAGIIMKVESPGGGVYQSEQIANTIKKIQKEKAIPVYTVMGSTAASGGYYISAPTDKIYASSETFTGSIGVIMQNYDLSGLFEKYGLKADNITSGKMKDAGSPGKALTEEQRAYLQELVDSAYGRFVKVVAEGREINEGEVKKLADGRVYDGDQAKKLGLVDEIGDFEKALDDMEETYGLQNAQVFQIVNNDPFSNLLGNFSKSQSGQASSDLQVLDKRMEENDLRPMYLMGGYHD